MTQMLAYLWLPNTHSSSQFSSFLKRIIFKSVFVSLHDWGEILQQKIIVSSKHRREKWKSFGGDKKFSDFKFNNHPDQHRRAVRRIEVIENRLYSVEFLIVFFNDSIWAIGQIHTSLSVRKLACLREIFRLKRKRERVRGNRLWH